MPDKRTLAAYDAAPESFAKGWAAQPPPSDLHAILRRHFQPGLTADIGCGSGRDAAWLAAQGFPVIGYDASHGLLTEARRHYPAIEFRAATLPDLDGVPTGHFANVLCETVIMHLPLAAIGPAVRRLVTLLAPGGVLYLSWRVTAGQDRRDEHGRLYTAFESALVRAGLAGMARLFEEEVGSLSSGKLIHRIVAVMPT